MSKLTYLFGGEGGTLRHFRSYPSIFQENQQIRRFRGIHSGLQSGLLFVIASTTQPIFLRWRGWLRSASSACKSSLIRPPTGRRAYGHATEIRACPELPASSSKINERSHQRPLRANTGRPHNDANDLVRSSRDISAFASTTDRITKAAKLHVHRVRRIFPGKSICRVDPLTSTILFHFSSAAPLQEPVCTSSTRPF